MAKIIHAMLRVLDLDRSIAFYADAFGLRMADRFEFDGFSLVYLRNAEADFELELTFNKGRTDTYALGDGYGHLAVCVDDLSATRDHLADAGVSPTPIRELSYDGRLLARFFFVQDPDGYKIEVVQKHGRYR